MTLPLYSQLFESVPDALIVVDGDGRIVLANPQAERLFGYGQGALTGLHVEALMPHGVRGRHQAHRADYMANPRTRPMGDTGQALTGQRRDGEQFPVEIALSPIESESGTRYLASIRDVSETQRARQALIRARYDTLVARIGQLALEAGDDAAVIERVPELLTEALDVEVVVMALLQPEADKVELRAAHGLDTAWAETAERMSLSSSRAWLTMVAGGPLVVDDSPRADARQLPFAIGDGARSALVAPLLDRDRPMGALVALSRQPRRFDHDALHLLQSVANMLAALMQRRRTEDQLAHSQRLDAVGKLTGGIAHDFNNLLTVMSGSLQLLQEMPQPPDAAEAPSSPSSDLQTNLQSEVRLQLIASALRAANRGAELTAKLLAFARRQRLDPGPVDPCRLLHDLESMLGRTLGDLVRVDVVCPHTIPCAYADATQLDAALVNLALNARDAMPRGGEVTLAASERWITSDLASAELAPGHYVVFSVSDTGLGMTDEALTRAIEPFFTTKDAGRGAGLGLSMAYGFVRQSGGHLRITSQLGYGTRVDLYLPVAPGGAKPAAPTATDLQAGRGETVLVVEDEAEVRRIAVAFLESVGYRVVAFGTARNALDHLKRDDTVHALFSDVVLADGMDGYQLAMASVALRPGLAVLLTSGYEQPLVDARPGELPRFELLRKPYRREQLAAALRRVLDSVRPA